MLGKKYPGINSNTGQEFEPFDLFGRIMAFKNGEWQEIFKIQMKELLTQGGSVQTSYNETSVFEESWGECTLSFNEGGYDQFNQCMTFLEELTPFLIEIYRYDNYEDLGEKEFNKIYFGNYANREIDQSNPTNDIRQVHFIDWDYMVEEATIPEHTKAYNKLPVDDSFDPPSKYKPKDYNFIKYDATYFHNIIVPLYNHNVLNPYKRNNGKSHNDHDSSRKPVGIGDFIFNNHNTDYKMSIHEEKGRTLHSIRSKFSKFISNHGYKAHHIQLKINNGKIDVYYNTFPDIIIDYNDLYADSIYYTQHEYDAQDGIKSTLVMASNNNAQNYVAKKSSSKNGLLKYFEGLTSLEGDEGNDMDNPNKPGSEDFMQPLHQEADTEIENGKNKNNHMIQLEFKKYTFFADIHCGQRVKIQNFNDIYDGMYRIDSMSITVDQTHNIYSIDKLTNLEYKD